jgi:hypothetical protein
MDQEQLMRDKLQAMARYIKGQLPGKDWGFILMTFLFGAGGMGNLLYVANAHRDDAVQAMREFIAKNTKNPKQYSDQGENTVADQAFEKWWQMEMSRLDGKCPTDWATVRQLAVDSFYAGMVWSVE